MSDKTKIDILAMLLGAASDTTSAVLQIFFKIAALFPDETEAVQSGMRRNPFLAYFEV